ncbi:MAG: LamG domain-containing protein [Bacteroidales bacterium]|nr:LamG domain-containing protein [Bacteroidales bacterium]
MKIRVVLVYVLSLCSTCSFAQVPVMLWNFEKVDHRNVVDKVHNITDTIEGNFSMTEGMSGQGLRFDGFTTRIIRKNEFLPKPGDEFTIEAWLALVQYPLNWCPVITTESNEIKGYRLMIGPYGQVSFETAISEQWIACTSGNETIPLRKWMYLTAVYTANRGMALYVNGELMTGVAIEGSLTFPSKSSCILGMVTAPARPSNTIRTWGTVPAFFGLDGIMDEVRVYDQAFTADQVRTHFEKYSPKDPGIPARHLPTLEKNPDRFGAYYTKLKYYPAWDTLWPVDQDPDIVVCFEKNPVKMIFWRGTRYGPCWVSENEKWMADQSLETWGVGEKDIEGCFEHMQDRHCRFSHVRIIENSEARAVIHWRYAPVSSHDHTWLPDPKTGWECWVDEYYFIYPDGSAVRKVSWNKGSTGRAVQFQESLPLTQPGQLSNEVVEDDYVFVADYDFNTISVSVDPDKKPVNWSGDYTVQQFNFKSGNKPFICFEPGNHMWVRWIGGAYNHFPVNQARSDGRWAKTSNRPTHFSSSPCSDPIIYENGNRLYWIGLYGMNTMTMNELISFGRSWAYAPELSLQAGGFVSKGYDKTQRCYLLEKTGRSEEPLEFTLKGSEQSPVINPAILVRNWNSEKAGVMVNGNTEIKSKVGVNHQLFGDDLVIYIPLKTLKPVKIRILP